VVFCSSLRIVIDYKRIVRTVKRYGESASAVGLEV
jgi:hypothetical protein